MFQFSGFPSYDYFIHHTMTEYCSAGFPHSEICGSKDICSYPQLIAACHVLHRLLMPRHSPCALLSLTSLGSPFELNYMSFFPLKLNLIYPLRKNSFIILCIVQFSKYKFILNKYGRHLFFCFLNKKTMSEWRWGESNSWPPACKAGALPAELHPHSPSQSWWA